MELVSEKKRMEGEKWMKELRWSKRRKEGRKGVG